MIRVIIGALVAAIIMFAFQAAMWMGGFHDNYGSYTDKQEEIINSLNQNLDKEGLYYIPMADPNDPNKSQKEEELMKQNNGKPWAMIFYHKKMNVNAMITDMIMGLVYIFIGALGVAIVLYKGGFAGFGARFFVSMAFALFAIFFGPMIDLNWWSYPWSFQLTKIIDIGGGWILSSIWLAWFIKSRNI